MHHSICGNRVEVILLTALPGNHDVTLDPVFYSEHGRRFHGRQLEHSHYCLKLIAESPSVIFLRHESASIRLTRADGPNTTFKVFGSPYSKVEGNWAFGYESKDAAGLWSQIPLDTDVLVTHTPPQSHCDQKPNGTFVGCDELRKTLSLIRPHLAICGHVHEGRGYERVRWRLLTAGETGTEYESQNPVDRVTQGNLPSVDSKKQSLVDLTGKQDERLDNEGFSRPDYGHGTLKSSAMSSASLGSDSPAGVPEKASPQKPLDDHPSLSARRPGHDFEHALQTLRKETCIVNASVVASSWPHQGGKRFNAPIVVDLDLPVWQADHAVANG
jgi:hypothetical protein